MSLANTQKMLIPIFGALIGLLGFTIYYGIHISNLEQQIAYNHSNTAPQYDDDGRQLFTGKLYRDPPMAVNTFNFTLLPYYEK